MLRGVCLMTETIGQVLSARRLAQAVALEKVAADLRISIEKLKALEADEIENVGHPSYTLGFLRSYAKYLELDSDALVEQAKAILSPTPQTEEEFIHIERQVEVPLSAMIAMAFAAIIVVFLIWMFALTPPAPVNSENFAGNQPQTSTPQTLDEVAAVSSAQSSGQPPLNPAPRQTAAEVVSTGNEAVGAVEVLELEPLGNEIDVGIGQEASPEASVVALTTNANTGLNGSKVQMSLRALRETWLRVSNSSDKVLFSSIVDVGTLYELNEDDLYYIASRDAGAIEIMRNGVVVGKLGQDSEIVARRELDISRYLTRP